MAAHGSDPSHDRPAGHGAQDASHGAHGAQDASHGAHGAGHGAHHDEPHGSLKLYLGVFGALIVLTIASFAVANTPAIMETRLLGWSLMFAISCGKAMLVVMFFMHLVWEANWKYVLTIPATLMSVFLILMLVPDIGMRTYHYSRDRWLHSAEPVVPAAARPDERPREEDPHGIVDPGH